MIKTYPIPVGYVFVRTGIEESVPMPKVRKRAVISEKPCVPHICIHVERYDNQNVEYYTDGDVISHTFEGDVTVVNIGKEITQSDIADMFDVKFL